MKIINASTEILTPITGDEIRRIEYAGRTCYKSEDKITDDSVKKFVENLAYSEEPITNFGERLCRLQKTHIFR